MKNAIKHVGRRLSMDGGRIAHDGVEKTGKMHRGELCYIRFVLVRGDGGTDPSFPKRGKESGDAVVGGGVKVAVRAVVGHEDRLQAGGVLRCKTVGGKRRRIFYVFQVFTGASGGHGERFLHVGFDAAAVAELHELCGKFMGLSQLESA